MRIASGSIGYPRIGADREWKRTLESYWSGKLPAEEFEERLKSIRLGHLRKQRDKGITVVPVGDFSYYDQVLDTAAMFGLVPERFAYSGGAVPLDVYYAMARGNADAAACEMTKWFNTNYHYIVPELSGREPELTVNRPLEAYREAKAELGLEGRPVLLGLLTFLKLSKGYDPEQLDEWIERLLPLYVKILTELEQEGVRWIQIDEPILCTSLSVQDLGRIYHIYSVLSQSVFGLKLLLQTYFESVDAYKAVIALPVHGIGLDLVHDRGDNWAALAEQGFPADKLLAAGVIDGRSIWRTDLAALKEKVDRLSSLVSPGSLLLQPSCSLLHVPVTVERETKLEPVLKEALAFADEKLDELVLLCKVVNGESSADVLLPSRQALERLAASPALNRKQVQEASASLAASASEPARHAPFSERRKLQQERFRLPLLPTTTIGSFPQTAEIRQARTKWRKGVWSPEHYEAFIREQIETWIGLQEEIGLDVLVHGEFERTDMVEYFGEKLAGFAFTANGWVQSYGSRCVKPPVIYGDVDYEGPMTVTETVYAQSLTNHPVKGMLTGPVTILNWSFVRQDLPQEQVAYQIALALRQEVEALEAAGIGMIQVDEPAIREGLPLKKTLADDYLAWAVRAFRIATSTVRDDTQIHTHMCYCEYHDMIDSIGKLDADVISIENSRSHGEIVDCFKEHTYDKGIGLGVYDIHSPRVPSIREMEEQVKQALAVLDPSLFWINPDCGLKTRGREETVASLRNMVQATRQARETLTLHA
ncbi:5-methyltetrahydropteroyltriglutamate--homocysteine S-methyltransferase [Gorillibacterium timonense]|uniref:5-methyltetrahydropteroyltriglutamate-- homocysteine S-methyltransferase n=1 Tax=Gorillibacterium timonense TaxID=1689269 RepID=UPI00071D059F|nr:5-methyltetrahydropteroyltriglutamate--homocysteine S-methyltransferase [Gorillibacterium timonense]